MLRPDAERADGQDVGFVAAVTNLTPHRLEVSEANFEATANDAPVSTISALAVGAPGSYPVQREIAHDTAKNAAAINAVAQAGIAQLGGALQGSGVLCLRMTTGFRNPGHVDDHRRSLRVTPAISVALFASRITAFGRGVSDRTHSGLHHHAELGEASRGVPARVGRDRPAKKGRAVGR